MRLWHVGMAAAGLLLVGSAAPLAAQGPPNPPVNLEADVTPESVFLTWEADNSGNRRTAVSFRIYRDGQHIGSTSDEEYFDSDVDHGEEYTYEVSGVDVLGREGNRSAPLTVVIPGGDPPDVPTDLVAEAVSASRIDLQWKAVGDDDDDDEPAVVGYYIYRDGGSSPHDSTGATQYSDTGLAAFTVYTYRVSAVTAGGVEGELSDPVSARTLDGSPPSAPQGLTAEATGARVVELAWDAAEDPESGVSAYRVYRDASLLDTSPGLDYVDRTVEPNTTYAYEVTAVNGVGLESAPASAPPVTTPDDDGDPADTVPDEPGNLVAEAVSASRIDLQWDAVGDGDDGESAVVGYYIYRNGSNVPHDSTGATQYSDTGLAAFTEYTYRVSAVTAGGVEGGLSDPASARTLDGSPPSAPSGVTAEAPGARFVELKWNAASDPESGISLYLVYRDGEATPIDSTTATTYADGTVEPETSYAYRVAARNGVGLEGAKSAEVKVTTPAATDQSPPSVPGDFTAEAVSADRVELTWSDADDPESGISAYRVYRDDALLGTSPGIGYVDLTVEPNTTYEYEVSAVNGDGLEGARASASPVTTPDADDEGPADTVPPAPPSGLRVISG